MKTFLSILLLFCLTSVVSAGSKGVKGLRYLEDTEAAPTAQDEEASEEKIGAKAKEDPKGHKCKDAKPKIAKDKECEEDKTGKEAKVGTSTSEEMNEPAMSSTSTAESSLRNAEVDCDAISNSGGPTSAPSVSLVANMDVLKDSQARMNDIYALMEIILQAEIAPAIAGCDTTGRYLQTDETSTEISNVQFGSPFFDTGGCGADFTVRASQSGGACLATDIPVDIYYTGIEDAEGFATQVKSSIEAHSWNIEGVEDVSAVNIDIMNPNSTTAMPVGAFASIAVVLLLCCVAGALIMKSQEGEAVKGEYEDTDEDSFTKERKKGHDDDDLDDEDIPVAPARRVYDP